MNFRPSSHRYGLAGLPRPVPLGIRLGVRFGGVLNQVGWLVVAIGMIFVWIFVVNADFSQWFGFDGELQTVVGEVIDSQATNSTENDERVFVHQYRFAVAGQTLQGTSYATGKQIQPGQRVTIEFPKGDPTNSRIQGMRTKMFGPFAAIAGIFPIIGLGLIFFGMIRAGKRLRLLRNGQQTTGTLMGKRATSMRVNSRHVYKLTFQFTAADGQNYEAIARSHRPENLSEKDEPLLYDPIFPNRATLLAHLPGSPEIDETGQIRSKRPGRAGWVLIAPVVTLAGHGAYAFVRFFA